QALQCTVNVQHNCMAHNCDGTASRPTFLEHEITAEHILAVCHYEPSDIMLNTVKMRDTAWM
ncbi:hypothetical protein C8Q72DRAFT_745273, partial [Fomitopsis betulina]